MCSFGARLQNSGLLTTFTVVHERSLQQHEIKAKFLAFSERLPNLGLLTDSKSHEKYIHSRSILDCGNFNEEDTGYLIS